MQVSYNDARAFCKFYELRLPTEAEWEFAAREGRGAGQRGAREMDRADERAVAQRSLVPAAWEEEEGRGGEGEEGNSSSSSSSSRVNTWQGEFPGGNTLEDGFLGAAPADAFEPK